MLKVNVGMSRKLTRDYNSTGFSLNLEGELCVGLDDPETMIERVKEFYDLAEEALNQQIERYESESAIAHRDETPAGQNGHGQNEIVSPALKHVDPPRVRPSQSKPNNGNGHSASGEAATNKQVQFLLNLGKRHGLTPPQLEVRIESIIGKKVGVYDLTKPEAGAVIDALNQTGTEVAPGHERRRTSR